MKLTKNILIILASLIFSDLALATNGSNLIGSTPASRSMGGTGVANFTNSSDAIFHNPALLSAEGQLGYEGAWMGTRFDAEVSIDDGLGGVRKSQAPAGLIPSLSLSYKDESPVSYGFGIFAVGGAESDYSFDSSLFRLHAAAQFMRIIPTVSYRVNQNFNVGVSPYLYVGRLSMIAYEENSEISMTKDFDTRAGAGLQVGISGKLFGMLTAGLSYISPVKIKYHDVINLDHFSGNLEDEKLDDLQIDQPDEIAFGLSIKPTSNWALTSDIRRIGWGNVTGPKQFGWKNQIVSNFGTEIKLADFSIRAGYNYGKSPIRGIADESGSELSLVEGQAIPRSFISRLNLIAFPVIAETHYTGGIGYQVSPNSSVDIAFVYSPLKTISRGGTEGTEAAKADYNYTGTMEQRSVTIGSSYRL